MPESSCRPRDHSLDPRPQPLHLTTLRLKLFVQLGDLSVAFSNHPFKERDPLAGRALHLDCGIHCEGGGGEGGLEFGDQHTALPSSPRAIRSQSAQRSPWSLSRPQSSQRQAWHGTETEPPVVSPSSSHVLPVSKHAGHLNRTAKEPSLIRSASPI